MWMMLPPPVLGHVSCHALGELPEPAHVDVEDAVPSLHRVLEGGRTPDHSGVVDQHVEPAHRSQGAVRQVFDLRFAGHVHGNHPGPFAPAPRCVAQSLRSCGACAKRRSRPRRPRASPSAMWRPMPRPPPVTSAVRPERSKSCCTRIGAQPSRQSTNQEPRSRPRRAAEPIVTCSETRRSVSTMKPYTKRARLRSLGTISGQPAGGASGRRV